MDCRRRRGLHIFLFYPMIALVSIHWSVCFFYLEAGALLRGLVLVRFGVATDAKGREASFTPDLAFSPAYWRLFPSGAETGRLILLDGAISEGMLLL